MKNEAGVEMTVFETLKAARKLIASEDDWYQASPGSSCGEKRVKGKLKRCSGAALAQVGAGWPEGASVFEYLGSFMKPDVPTFNDTHTHAEVLAAFDAAIAKAEASHVA